MKRSAEVVIVGGGCMGASVACYLARRGMTDVVLVERETMLATGSTGRNAGGVRHQFSNAANIRLSIESIAVLERFAGEVGQPIDFHQDGYLFLLSTQAGVETFRRNVALQRSLGVDVEWLDAPDAARLAPGLRADVNLIDFDALQVQKPELVHDMPANGRRFVQRVEGYEATLVAGEPIFERGEATGAMPGKLVRAGQIGESSKAA